MGRDKRLQLSLLTMAVVLAVLGLPSFARAQVKWRDALNQKREWYATDEAVRVADNLITYQRVSGGWPKNIDMAMALDKGRQAQVIKQKTATDSTIDNGATYSQLRFLARVYTARGLARHQDSFLRGFDYLLEAQYDNGGWPQYFPLIKGYYQHITFNDDAMIGVMRVLDDIAQKNKDYLFVDEARRERAAQAVAKGVECILKTQVQVHGSRTVWCAQHDEVTLAPAPARAYEHVSLSGKESVGIVEFLMSIDRPETRVVEAVESAIAWFKKSQLNGIRLVQVRGGPDWEVVADDKAPPLWARFYEIETNRPIFSGRDGVIKYSVSEIESERRDGYGWYTDAPAKLLNRDYPAWLKKVRPMKAE